MLDVDEAALCSVACRFWEFDSPCLVVGTAYNMTLKPRYCPKASIKVFAYNSDYRLHLIHSVSAMIVLILLYYKHLSLFRALDYLSSQFGCNTLDSSIHF